MVVKRLNPDPQSQPEKRGKAHQSEDCDRLSELPNDVLILILSSLPLRDAARSTILSSRWTNLWRHSSCLNFDAAEFLHKIGGELTNAQRDKFINWVNSLLRSHKAPMLDGFSICFDFDKSSHEAITLWLQFAFARRVEKLELRCLTQKCTYDFPAAVFSGPTLLKSLKALRLTLIHVTDEDIAFFLHNCPFLEQLIVQGSHKISKVEVCGSSLALKHLEIFDTFPVRTPSIKISAPNLASLKVDTLWGGLLENVPMLVKLNLLADYRDLHYCKLLHLQQLEILSTSLTMLRKHPRVLPQMPKLKKFKVMISRCEGHIMKLTSFMHTFPHLQEFEIKMMGSTFPRGPRGVENGFMHFTHQHLKVFKLSGNYGSSYEIEFARIIWMNCVALQKIIIDPHFQPFNSCSDVLPTRANREDIVRMEQTTRRHAKQRLQPLVPKHIKLLIL